MIPAKLMLRKSANRHSVTFMEAPADSGTSRGLGVMGSNSGFPSPLASTLGKSLTLSELQFLYLYNEKGDVPAVCFFQINFYIDLNI